MTNLEVSFKQQLIANGGRIPEGQIFDDLIILWDAVRGHEYYTIRIENIDSRKLYLLDINIYDRTKGESLISPWHSLPTGTYRVSLYGQNGVIEADTAEDVSNSDLEELQTLTFISGPVIYGRSPRSPPKRKRSPSPRRSRSPSSSPVGTESSNPYYRSISTHRERGRSEVIVKGTLSGDEQTHRKFCGCVIDVGKEQSPACLEGKRWYQQIEGKSCYNPYAVCASSLRTSPAQTCYEHYNFDKMSDAELVTVALLHEVPYPKSWNGEKLPVQTRKDLLKTLKSKKPTQ